nr:MAG TPA: hypothetical protein [Caudoviricetes sp.]
MQKQKLPHFYYTKTEKKKKEDFLKWKKLK